MNTNLKRDRYSIIVYPSPLIRYYIKGLKNILAKRVGWYSSRNSEAHITILEFDAFESELAMAIRYTKLFCYAQKQFHVSFDKIVNSHINTCVFALPDESSKPNLNKVLKMFRKNFKGINVKFGTNAHISIARNMNDKQLNSVDNIFDEIDLNFECDTIAIRKLNSMKGQFEVIYQFNFLGYPPIEGQLDLFE
ncbi:2'-5' RNA ligase family protein [Pedobacter paludis]|uniref:2'-5' RNA ligase n=1 Tax=Pedobacter paludis TaxID=2203212 RepID=A0A317F3M8_9SPHI|nr:2'-5' RNA ligase family protein [Pedobacter paludis]PWS33781.1 hypothetical protein DF947_04015 [Pedobacter paludis]